MLQHADRRRWVLPALAAAVLVVAATTGMVLRQFQTTADAAGGGSSGGTTSVSSPTKEPGPRTVELTGDVAVHPDAQRVRTVLQNHFDAINSVDYALWARTVTAERARATGSGVWRQQYRSTLDGNVVVHRLEARLGGGLVALLSFTSVQDPADAPPDLPVRCLRWRVSYPLIRTGDELRLDLSTPNASLRTPC
jgi:hypothetical protein